VKIDDPNLDYLDPEIREAELVDAFRNQISFARSNVPFWHRKLAKAGVDESRINNLSDISKVPILTKEEFRKVTPLKLIPKENLSKIYFNRWTSGTTGTPTVSCWTVTDWAAAVASVARTIGRQSPTEQPVAFNAFSQGHVTGPLIGAGLRKIGAPVFDRGHHPEEVFSTAAHIDLFEFNTIVIPGRSVHGKAVGLDGLLAENPIILVQHGVLWWIGAAGTFEAETINRAMDQGVESISNFYGSSEFAPFALSCSNHSGDFHISQGHVFVEVVNEQGFQVENGEFGRIVVTHLCGMYDNGDSCVHGGTQIIRLAAGDGATYFDEPCACGLTTPRIKGIQRV
jgi:phenylacetate-CoA ligase